MKVLFTLFATTFAYFAVADPKYCTDGDVCVVEDESLRFLVIGDFGGSPLPPYRTPVQNSCASSANKVALADKTHFQVTTGDNFYFNGVTSVDDSRFRTTFEQAYTGEGLQSLWYISLGNHDHDGNAKAQIEYTERSERWVLPDYFYTINYRLKPSNTTIEFVVIDTDIMLKRENFPEDAPRQDRFIQEKLSQSKADYLFVVSHHPLYSVGFAGNINQLIRELLPTFHKYKITAMIAGHDHNLQDLACTSANHTVRYVVVGMSAYSSPNLNVNNVPANSLLYHYSGSFIGATGIREGGFGQFQISAKEGKMIFYDKNGKNLYEGTFPKRKL